ncbi:HEAT repeat domain-containing protein [Uliginosibacterium sp. H3]|uniref:HEAT repeat domain-containing protein n=1 Tax=Uliginosibacterium silvisoli TaxID=3114758 RepID=A0ABU6K154_9RHOO|nr:HEAT repeat domain-containing protein [Uliginosibacterium sp. H3]
MKNIFRSLKGGVLTSMLVSATLLSGCAVSMKVPVQDAVPSSAQYVKSATATPVALYFSDDRTPENKTAFINSFFGMSVTDKDDKPLDSFAWLANNVVAEMKARGLPVTRATSATGANTIVIKRLFIESRRVSGFSPFETFTSVSADVVTTAGTQRIAAFIKRGKVPVWSFTEIYDPNYNQPLSLAAKEFAAKLGRIMFDAKLSDAQVDAAIAKTSGDKIDFRDVHELGFSNNARAIPQLVKLVPHKDDEVSQGAVSALGMLRAAGQFPLLKEKAENTKDDWEDRATALKAIGDLGTPEALAYLKAELARVDKLTDADSVRTKGVLGLYLN